MRITWRGSSRSWSTATRTPRCSTPTRPSASRTRILARIAAFAMTFERPKQLAFRTLSQTGIAYRESPLSKMLPGLPDGAPRAGDRFPWLRLRFEANGPVEDLFQKVDDTRYNLIVIGQPAPSGEELGALLSTHVIPDDTHNTQELARVRISGPAFYLLRPDGHVGLAGTRLEPDAITRYLSESCIRTQGKSGGGVSENSKME